MMLNRVLTRRSRRTIVVAVVAAWLTAFVGTASAYAAPSTTEPGTPTLRLYEGNSGVLNVAATGFPVDLEATVVATAAGDRAVQRLRSDGLGGFVVNFHVTAPQQLEVTVDASAGGKYARATLAYTGGNAEPDPLSPPALSLAQRTISWKRVAGVGEYQLATKVRGRAPTYSVVPCCSLRLPESADGMSFGLRTNVPGSHWATEVELEPRTGSSADESATSPLTPSTASRGSSSSTTSTTTAESEPSSPGTSATSPSAGGVPSVKAAPVKEPGGFEVGIVGAGPSIDAAQQARSLGARVERIEFTVGADIGPAVGAAAASGLRLQPLVGWRNGSSPPDLRVVADWAAKYGPGGSYWAGRSDAYAITEIELGNENSFSYKSGDATSARYAELARQYGNAAVAAARAVKAANPKVGVLVELEDGNTGSSAWIDNTLAGGGPDLAALMHGPVIHAYGPSWRTRVARNVGFLRAKGVTKPYYMTEWGIATDNGAQLNDNYGFPKNLTYEAAASLLTANVEEMAQDTAALRQVLIYRADDGQASGSGDREAYFGLKRTDGSSKGSLTAAATALFAEYS